MGADGGINWVNVTGDKDEFYKLVRPLGLLWDGSDYHDEYHDEYLEKHPLPKPKTGFYETSTYGTSNSNQGLDDLRDVIRELREYMRPSRQPFDSEWGDANPLDLTWLEMLTEYYTADYWKDQSKYFLPTPMQIMLERCDWVYDQKEEKLTKYDHPTFHITLREWLARIRKVIDVKSFGSAETWT
jgi:hypothetical protein